MVGVIPGDWPKWQLKDGEVQPNCDLVPPPCFPTGPTPPADRCDYCNCRWGHHSYYCSLFKAPHTDNVTALPTDYNERKALPLYDFMFGYFPLAWLEVVKVAVVGNDQHNPGEKLHWAREKSTDQLNAAFRHLFDHGMGTPLDTDGCYHLAKVIWRLSAELQLLVEKSKAQP